MIAPPISPRPGRILLLLGVVLVAACGRSEGPAPGAVPGAAKPVPEVKVMEVHPQSVPITRELVGRLAPTRSAQVRARVAGVLLERVYTEGTEVEPGQLLFRIDPARLQAEVRAQEAALAGPRRMQPTRPSPPSAIWSCGRRRHFPSRISTRPRRWSGPPPPR
jgi:multidrug efflux pump subunit AcrA (membrane-fusion protein)